jgi:protein-S-isoprenylcysteine O-methyltransferase Ste14
MTDLAYVALVLQAIFLLTAFVLRSILHARRTGSFGFRVGGGKRAVAHMLGVGGITAAAIGSVIGVALDVSNSVPDVGPLDTTVVGIAGCAVSVLGIAVVLKGQADMGSSWRIGQDSSETTDLVTTGLFRWTRNPIFLGMLLFWAGISLAAPNVVTIASTIVAFAAIEVQVRLVEEPHLIKSHGRAYQRYASTAGRLIPWFGRLPS